MWIPVRKFYLEDGDLKNRLLYKHANIHVFSYIRARWAKVMRSDVFPIICYFKEKRRKGRKGGRDDVIKYMLF